MKLLLCVYLCECVFCVCVHKYVSDWAKSRETLYQIVLTFQDG